MYVVCLPRQLFSPFGFGASSLVTRHSMQPKLGLFRGRARTIVDLKTVNGFGRRKAETVEGRLANW